MDKKQKNIIIARNISRRFFLGNTVVDALTDINLEVKKGEYIAVMGPSGSGKTTLLNMLGALDRPTKGQVIIDGLETTKVPERKLYEVRRKKLGFIFQTYYLIPKLTALDNILLPVMPVGINEKFIKTAKELLDTVGLSKRKHHKPKELSGGEQQRVAIARALILDAPILLADEPTGNLDSKSGQGIIDLMVDLNKNRNKTIIMVTHDIYLAKRTDRTVHIIDGRITEK